KLPGVRCSTLKTECRSLLCLMIMPGRSWVAGIAITEGAPYRICCVSLDRLRKAFERNRRPREHMAAAAAVGLSSDFRWFVGFWEFADFGSMSAWLRSCPATCHSPAGNDFCFSVSVALSAVKASALLRDD